MSLSATLLPERLAVCRLPPDAPLPSLPGPFLSITRTAEELSVVCALEHAPEATRRSEGWRALKLEGPFELSVCGVLAPLATALAGAGVSLLPIATFDTDYLLIREEHLERAVPALAEAGCTVRPASPSSTAG